MCERRWSGDQRWSAKSRWEPRRSLARQPTTRIGARHSRKRHAKPSGWLLVLPLLAGVWLLWQQEPALRQAVLGWLAFIQHAGWWLDSVIVLLGVGLVGGLGWLWRSTRQAMRQRARAHAAQLRALHVLDPLAFERQVGQWFARAGYRVSYTAYSGDEGIDLWVERQPVAGTRMPLRLLKPLVGGSAAGRIPVQCKRYGAAHAVGSPDLQRFSGALRRVGATTGIFVTTSRFTPAARVWARNEGIQLIDGAALARWHARLLPSMLFAPQPERGTRPHPHEGAEMGQKGRNP